MISVGVAVGENWGSRWPVLGWQVTSVGVVGDQCSGSSWRVLGW